MTDTDARYSRDAFAHGLGHVALQSLEWHQYKLPEAESKHPPQKGRVLDTEKVFPGNKSSCFDASGYLAAAL
jgi:hypothetical protein